MRHRSSVGIMTIVDLVVDKYCSHLYILLEFVDLLLGTKARGQSGE